MTITEMRQRLGVSLPGMLSDDEGKSYYFPVPAYPIDVIKDKIGEPVEQRLDGELVSLHYKVDEGRVVILGCIEPDNEGRQVLVQGKAMLIS